MVDGAPEIAELAFDLHERLIQMPPPLRIAAHARNAIFGGTTRFVVTYLIGATGDPTSPAWYVTLTSIVTAVAM